MVLIRAAPGRVVLVLMSHVGPRRATMPDESKTPCSEKRLSVRRKDASHQRHRQVVHSETAPLSRALSNEKIGDEVRLDFGRV